MHASPSCRHWCDFDPGHMPWISWVACRGISVGRGENACAHSPSCQHWCNVKHRSWPIFEGHLGDGVQGGYTCQPFLLNSICENLGAYGGPSGPPATGIQGGCTCQLFLLNSIFENLGAYGGPSGPQGSRVTVPASCSSTPSLRIWGLMEGHLGHGDPGWLYLPAVPPQLHL